MTEYIFQIDAKCKFNYTNSIVLTDRKNFDVRFDFFGRKSLHIISDSGNTEHFIPIEYIVSYTIKTLN